MIQHRVNNNEVTTVELCDNCETYVRDLALEDYLIKDDLLQDLNEANSQIKVFRKDFVTEIVNAFRESLN